MKNAKSLKSKKGALESSLARNPGYSLIISMEFENIIEFKRYYSAYVDLNFCLDILDQVKLLLPNFPVAKNLEEKERLSERIAMQSLSFAYIMSYGRCFLNSNGRKNINVERVIENNKTLLSLHKEIISIRNQYVAHEDHSNYEDYPLTLLINKDTNHLRIIFSAAKSFHFFNEKNIHDHLKLINLAIGYCNNNAISYREKLEAEFNTELLK